MEKYIPDIITEPQLEAIEDLFRENLPPSPIDLQHYETLCENDEVAEELLISMIEKCLDYAVDVSKMERYVREHHGERDEDREAVDRARSITHNATIDSINIFSRYISKQFQEPSFVKWDQENRGAYGKFAILLTLNTFKDKIILDVVRKKTSAGEIDTSILRKNATESELLVLDYVDVLCKAEKEDRALDGKEQEQLSQIEIQLDQSAEKILGAFHEIYIKRY